MKGKTSNQLAKEAAVATLNIFENGLLPAFNRLQLQLDRALEPVAQHLFSVANEKVHLSGRYRLANKAGYSDDVVLALDDDFGAKEVVPCSAHEPPDEDVFNGRFGWPSAFIQGG